MKTFTRGPFKFDSEFLQSLSDTPNSGVQIVNYKYHLGIHPFQLNDFKNSLKEELSKKITRYDKQLQGVVLGYKHIRLASDLAPINYDSPFIHADVYADFYVFKPVIGLAMQGTVTKTSKDHVGCLVYHSFNVSLPKYESDNWLGDGVNAGDEVGFRITYVDLEYRFPYIRGELLSVPKSPNKRLKIKEERMEETVTKKKKHKKNIEEQPVEDEEINGAIEYDENTPKKKKKHKNQYTENDSQSSINTTQEETLTNESTQKKRKKKKKHDDTQINTSQEETFSSDTTIKEHKKSKKHKRIKQEPIDEDIDLSYLFHSGKDTDKSISMNTTQEETLANESTEKKKKKKKKHDDTQINTSQEETFLSDTMTKEHKKSEKDKRIKQETADSEDIDKDKNKSSRKRSQSLSLSHRNIKIEPVSDFEMEQNNSLNENTSTSSKKRKRTLSHSAIDSSPIKKKHKKINFTQE